MVTLFFALHRTAKCLLAIEQEKKRGNGPYLRRAWNITMLLPVSGHRVVLSRVA